MVLIRGTEPWGWNGPRSMTDQNRVLPPVAPRDPRTLKVHIVVNDRPPLPDFEQTHVNLASLDVHNGLLYALRYSNFRSVVHALDLNTGEYRPLYPGTASLATNVASGATRFAVVPDPAGSTVPLAITNSPSVKTVRYALNSPTVQGTNNSLAGSITGMFSNAGSAYAMTDWNLATLSRYAPATNTWAAVVGNAWDPDVRYGPSCQDPSTGNIWTLRVESVAADEHYATAYEYPMPPPTGGGLVGPLRAVRLWRHGTTYDGVTSGAFTIHDNKFYAGVYADPAHSGYDAPGNQVTIRRFWIP